MVGNFIRLASIFDDPLTEIQNISQFDVQNNVKYVLTIKIILVAIYLVQEYDCDFFLGRNLLTPVYYNK